jgi:hypothetical protein
VYVTSAILELLPIGAGGLTSPIVGETRSLLVVFGESIRDPKATILGARIVLDHQETAAAGESQIEVSLEFWAPEAETYARAGAHFRIWYASRVVGSGDIRGTK